MRDVILTNARLVLPDGEALGSLVIRDGRLAEIQPGPSHLPGAEDCEGDYLIPGGVDLHTDNLERQVLPRASARWPSRSAMLAHDAQCAAAGVTTVLDALCLGDLGFDRGRIQTFRDGVRDLDSLADTGLLKSEHLLHLRCELPAADMPAELDTVADHPRVVMASLMDHSPGVGQYRDVERYRVMRARQLQLTGDAVGERVEFLLEQRARLLEPHRRWLLQRLAHRALPLASHDDDTIEQVRRNAADGIAMSEFPVTMEAAAEARRLGLGIIAGAPNIVRGGSHSGNLSVADLLPGRLVDALASDYVPASMVEGAWRAAATGALPLHAAIALITAAPAAMIGLHDRGRLAPGLRADLVRITVFEGLPHMRQTWRQGRRVA
jgi:alpha-D-ribose 1-methylphosphonate 5-triphosphate diphosphatase